MATIEEVREAAERLLADPNGVDRVCVAFTSDVMRHARALLAVLDELDKEIVVPVQGGTVSYTLRPYFEATILAAWESA